MYMYSLWSNAVHCLVHLLKILATHIQQYFAQANGDSTGTIRFACHVNNALSTILTYIVEDQDIHNS